MGSNYVTYTVQNTQNNNGPSRRPIDISFQIEVNADNKILVPGCEPTTGLSSIRLSAWLATAGCGNAIVDLQTALDNIPGSYIKLGNNFNRGNRRQKWFVLPPASDDCPCDKQPDWYSILRELANEELPEEESFELCDVIGTNYCPSPDFNEQYTPPEPSPYREEGTFPAGVGLLPPLPPWMVRK